MTNKNRQSTAKAEKIHYDRANNILTLKGNAHMAQGNKIEMQSDFIEYLANSEEVSAKASLSASSSSSRVNILYRHSLNKLQGIHGLKSNSFS